MCFLGRTSYGHIANYWLDMFDHMFCFACFTRVHYRTWCISKSCATSTNMMLGILNMQSYKVCTPKFTKKQVEAGNDFSGIISKSQIMNLGGIKSVRFREDLKILRWIITCQDIIYFHALFNGKTSKVLTFETPPKTEKKRETFF